MRKWKIPPKIDEIALYLPFCVQKENNRCEDLVLMIGNRYMSKSTSHLLSLIILSIFVKIIKTCYGWELATSTYSLIYLACWHYVSVLRYW